jgi:hypothetical protein
MAVSSGSVTSQLTRSADRRSSQLAETIDISFLARRAAEAAAVAEFDLSDEQRRRLVVQERN